MTTRIGSMHRVFTKDHARAMGYDDYRIRRMVERGHWIRLRYGVYATADDFAAAKKDPVQWHALQCAAVLLSLTPRYLAAAASSARLYGLDFLVEPPDEVVLLTDDEVVHGIHRDGYLLRQAPLPDGHRTRRHGIPLTSPARTLLDLAAELPFMDGVVPVDCALHRGLVDPEELQRILESAAGRPGIEQARMTFGFADAAAESALESASRVVFHLHGLPPPQTQVERVLSSGRRIRGDFVWADDLWGEADGQSKYAPDGNRTTLDVIRDEKQREQEMRDDGLEVIRWGWREVHQQHLLVHRVRAGMARTAERRRGRSG
ncbi:MAG: type IV toxin-antitoxin system AbiEi family antitoxin domain-containing protein [Sporichthyaceae bacterium]